MADFNYENNETEINNDDLEFDEFEPASMKESLFSIQIIRNYFKLNENTKQASHITTIKNFLESKQLHRQNS